MRLPLASIVALLLTLANSAWADVSRDDAVTMAQKISGGRVLSVELTAQEERRIWRVKVLTAQGEVKLILIDAASGRTL